MTAYFLALLLSAAPAAAQEGVAPAEGLAVSTAAIVVSTSALSAPELKRLRNSEMAALKKKQAAETEALARSMKGKPAAEARRAMKELKAAHEDQLAVLKARHGGKKYGPVLKDGAAGGGKGEGGEKRPLSPEKKP